MPDNVVVLGAGGWGTAVAGCLAQGGQNVALWCRRPEFASQLQQARENSRYLPGILIPARVKIVTEVPEEADVYVIGVPTQFIRGTLKPLKKKLNPETPMVSLAKGIEQKTLLRPMEVFAKVVGSKRTAVLSGPSHAEEVGRGMPTTVVLAAEEESLRLTLQHIFHRENLRVYASDDPAGVELAGALKNVLALAAGIVDGLGFGDNAKAALVSRGVVEISRIGEALGAQRSTFFGLAGIGDIVTSCYSRHGRNLSVGKQIGGGKTLDSVLEKMTMVAEGVWTSLAAQKLARKHKVETPIIDEVCKVLFEDKPPVQAVGDLMSREAKSEGLP